MLLECILPQHISAGLGGFPCARLGDTSMLTWALPVMSPGWVEGDGDPKVCPILYCIFWLWSIKEYLFII
jgi:hypothetical protein